MKILVNPEAGARMSVAEAMTNLCMAVVSDIKVTSSSLNFQNARIFIWRERRPIAHVSFAQRNTT